MFVRGTILAALLLSVVCGPACRSIAAGRLGGIRERLPPLAAPSDRNYFEGEEPHREKIELGRLLFFDKVLSGNRNISCATCHHPTLATGDGLSLSIGEGGHGLGPARDTGSGANRIPARVPRNAPALFNLGAREFRRLFHDGRIELDRARPSGFRSPAGDDLPQGLDNALAAQAMFPVTSSEEMAGHGAENEIASVAAADRRAGPGGVWDLLAARLRRIPEYVRLFRVVFDDVREAEDITFVHAANAIAAFEAYAFRADESPFDRFLRGERWSMGPSAERGMRLFYGRAGCSGCHSGVFQTDHEFHAIAMPQLGPGKGDGTDGREDFGRERVTGRAADRHRFRTPSLRNVTLTGPWGHAGAYGRLDEVVLHHLYPAQSLYGYDPRKAILPSRPDLDEVDTVVAQDPERIAAIAAASELPVIDPPKRHVGDLLEFLWALTDPRSTNLDFLVPEQVPSGLPVAD